MRGPERVVHKQVGQSRPGGSEFRIVHRLAGVKAGVLEQRNLSVA